MLMIFYRKNDPSSDAVSIKAVASIDGATIPIGSLSFPKRIYWAKFATALQSGALGIADLEIRIETEGSAEKGDSISAKTK